MYMSLCKFATTIVICPTTVPDKSHDTPPIEAREIEPCRTPQRKENYETEEWKPEESTMRTILP